MKVGDKVTLTPSTVVGELRLDGRKKRLQPITYPGTVVYIHPRRMFYTVRFDFEFGSFRESFPFH